MAEKIQIELEEARRPGYDGYRIKNLDEVVAKCSKHDSKADLEIIAEGVSQKKAKKIVNNIIADNSAGRGILEVLAKINGLFGSPCVGFLACADTVYAAGNSAYANHLGIGAFALVGMVYAYLAANVAANAKENNYVWDRVLDYVQSKLFKSAKA
jgi:hypothetical protein